MYDAVLIFETNSCSGDATVHHQQGSGMTPACLVRKSLMLLPEQSREIVPPGTRMVSTLAIRAKVLGRVKVSRSLRRGLTPQPPRYAHTRYPSFPWDSPAGLEHERRGVDARPSPAKREASQPLLEGTGHIIAESRERPNTRASVALAGEADNKVRSPNPGSHGRGQKSTPLSLRH
jgi:hypothetical protein